MLKKILVIDDSPVARMILKKCLPQKSDFEIFEASDGKEGVKKFMEIQPDVTLLDLTMPVMDGFQALTEIKKEKSNAVIVVLTADIQQKTIDKVIAMGAVTVVQKPPSVETIAVALSKAEQHLM